MTPIFTCGFECGRIGTAANTLGEHFGFPSLDTGTISTTTVRSGARSLRIFLSSQADRYSSTLFTASNIFVARIYINFASLPTTDAMVAYANSLNAGVIFKSSDSKLYAGYYDGATYQFGATGVTITTGVWYRIDIKINASANPWNIDVKVDGTDCGQKTKAVAAATTTSLTLGHLGSSVTSMDAFYDDIIISVTEADYPIGAGYVNHFVPTSDGTHNVAGANDFERSATGTDITNATTTAFQLIDDVPLESAGSSPTDYINLVAPPNATNYVECIFGPASGISTPTTAPRAVQAIFAIAASATGTNNIRLALNDNGTTDDVFNGAYATSLATIQFKTKCYADPPSAATVWTLSGNGNFNDIRVRCYTSDAAPDPYFVSAMLEAEFAEVVITPSYIGGSGLMFLGVGML